MSAERISERLRAQARRQGFDAVGIARADALERDRARLGDWLRREQQAGMTWMEREPDKRADPRRLLPGCRSVVALAMSYWPGTERAAGRRGTAQVALYARGRDYHKILGKQARTLATWLAEESGQPTRAFVDTGPVLERAWAERAGVGWIGKNSNLIRRDMGSWLLLAEILSVAELEPDPGPYEDFCGTCSACIQACPTDAIVAPGVVDSNRCISYWTIEHRGPIPAERRAGLGDWMFGCDDCQTVCPWNVSFAREADAERFGLREDLRGLDPEEILVMDETTFRARYSGTSLMRAKWEGIRRNACIVLGNRGDARAVPALAAALGDPDPVLRRHAAWAMGRIGGAQARAALEAARARESDATVLREIDGVRTGR